MGILHAPRRISRRAFVLGTASAASAIAVGGAVSRLPGAFPGALAARPRPSTRNPLYIPPAFSPTGFTLTGRPAQVDLGGGRLSNVWAYNSLLPGPTLVAARGDTATINLYNALSQPTITHWHGMIVDYLNDGNPRLVIPTN